MIVVLRCMLDCIHDVPIPTLSSSYPPSLPSLSRPRLINLHATNIQRPSIAPIPASTYMLPTSSCAHISMRHCWYCGLLMNENG